MDGFWGCQQLPSLLALLGCDIMATSVPDCPSRGRLEVEGRPQGRSAGWNWGLAPIDPMTNQQVPVTGLRDQAVEEIRSLFYRPRALSGSFMSHSSSLVTWEEREMVCRERPRDQVHK